MVGTSPQLPHSPPLQPDFSADVLADLYRYGRKRRWLAYLLWAALGWLGVHRFYLERPFTGIAQLMTGGGLLVWWLTDGFRVGRLVREHNDEQARREAAGEPPIELKFMPPLRAGELEHAPAWVERRHAQGRARKALRLVGDLLVLAIAGVGLGAVSVSEGALEAVAAVALLSIMIALGAGPDWLDDVPGFNALTRWTHRLRLFYWQNEPGSPPVLMLRGLFGLFWAPFRAKDRAEVRMYVELGAVFSAIFLLLDVVPALVGPLFSAGEAFSLDALLDDWLGEAVTTFVLVYLLAAPVGGVLTFYLLVQRTHTLPRILAGFTLAALAFGLVSELLG